MGDPVSERENQTPVQPDAAEPADSSNAAPNDSPHTIEIQLRGLPGSSSETALQFQQLVQTFVDDISQEVSRMEEGNRADGEAEPAGTASVVLQSYQLIKRPPVPAPRRPSRFTWTVRLVQPITGLATGIMLTLLHSAWQASLCTASALLFLMTTGMLLRGEVR